MGFTHLHVHTEYSLLDGMSKIKPLVSRAKELGFTSLAITDHGVCYGWPTFYSECKAQGIKPILGCEVYVAPNHRSERDKDVRYYHLILLIKNEIGYKNLCKMVTISNTEGFYYKPRIDWELLQNHHEGLICTSACIAGEIPQKIITNTDYMSVINKYHDLFGDDFYLEIQNHGIKEELLVTEELTKISRQTGIKLICTNDSHYINSDDKEAHDWLLCMQTNKTIFDADRMTYEGDYSLKSEEEMRSLYPALPDAFDNTLEIAEKCNFDFTYGEYRMPKVYIPAEYGTDYFSYLKDEAYKGFTDKYGVNEEAKKRLDYELSVVKQMNFAEYFLDTRKTIKWAQSHGILVGPGRGSGAGSVMNYCLGITDLEPLKYNLLFERFLNPERISMPDIDVDYAYDKKDEVVGFEADSNGRDKFCKIQTFITMNAKGIIKDCGKVAGIDFQTRNNLTKLIDDKMSLKQAWEANPDLRAAIQESEELQKVWNISLKLEGFKKTTSIHACGHIPTPVPCSDLFPCSVDNESGLLVCQYDMAEAEHLGNLKKDLLMLRNLTVIQEARYGIKRDLGIDVPLWTDEILNDADTLNALSEGRSDGVFQLESEGMKDVLKKLKPDCFEDVIAIVSLYRPGPMDYIPEYIEGKHHPESIKYLTPELEDILKATYGVIVYQEQVMQIVQRLAGFSMGRADVVRKAMGKKKMDVMAQEKEHFIHGDDKLGIKGCVANGISEEIASEIWGRMEKFAEYAFNKSHAACYAALSMQTAYLKTHYQVYFFSGLLSSVMDKKEKLSLYVQEAKRMEIKVLKPNINTSTKTYTVDNGQLSFGLSCCKNLGGPSVDEIINNRPFSGFTDFIQRTKINKSAIESLVLIGAFDFTGVNRKTLFNNIEKTIKYEKRNQIEGQMSLFELFDNSDHFAPEKEYTPFEYLSFEKENAGYYISGHPAEQYALYKGTYSKDLLEIPNSENIYVFGLVTGIRKTYTKKDKKPMAFFTIEDVYGKISCIAFPKAYENVKSSIKEGNLCVFYGSVLDKNQDEENVSVSISSNSSVMLDLDKIGLDPSMNEINAMISNSLVHNIEDNRTVLYIKLNNKIVPLSTLDKNASPGLFMNTFSARYNLPQSVWEAKSNI